MCKEYLERQWLQNIVVTSCIHIFSQMAEYKLNVWAHSVVKLINNQSIKLKLNKIHYTTFIAWTVNGTN